MANILVCDDDGFARVNLARVLAAEGYSVDTAARMPEAVRKIMANRYDLVVLDAHIEGIGGIQPVSLIRSIDSKIAIVVMAEGGSLEARRRIGIGENVFYYPVRLMNSDGLKATVKSVLEGKVNI